MGARRPTPRALRACRAARHPRRLAPDDIPDWLVGVIEEHGAPVDLAGHSLGALVSVRVAALRPDLVRRLVLIAPPGIRSRRSVAYAWPLVRSVARSRPGFLVRLTTDALRAGPRNLVRGGRHVARAEVGADLASVTAPTLLLWGEHDRLVRPRRRAVARASPRCAARSPRQRPARPHARGARRASRGDRRLPRGTTRRAERPGRDLRSARRVPTEALPRIVRAGQGSPGDVPIRTS